MYIWNVLHKPQVRPVLEALVQKAQTAAQVGACMAGMVVQVQSGQGLRC